MVVVMQERATEDQIEKVVAHLVELGMDVHRSTGVSRTVLGAVGDDRQIDAHILVDLRRVDVELEIEGRRGRRPVPPVTVRRR